MVGCFRQLPNSRSFRTLLLPRSIPPGTADAAAICIIKFVDHNDIELWLMAYDPKLTNPIVLTNDRLAHSECRKMPLVFVTAIAFIYDTYAVGHPDFIRVVHKKNGGLSSARNVGLAVAQGDYLGLNSVYASTKPLFMLKIEGMTFSLCTV